MFTRFKPIFNRRYLSHALVDSMRQFSFQQQLYQYFCHRYNVTYLNERAVEVPIIWREVQKYDSKDVLEIGNVLAHYYKTEHKVVDKYEVDTGVINKDIVGYTSRKKFKLIVSISTLEHVGWDEKPRSKTKILRAMQSVKKLLAPGGVAWITLPLGYNTYLDSHLRSGKLRFDEAYFLQRISLFNSWKEVSSKIIKKRPKYNAPFQNANVIVIGKYTR